MAWEAELGTLSRVIRMAGAEALRLGADAFDVHTKADDSPVTSVDLAVNHLLHHHLLDAFPHDGWLSEETPDTGTRLSRRRVWIIDPIDGTKAFIRKEPEYCVSVALVEEGCPVVAAIYNPSSDELFSAARGAGLFLNGRPVSLDSAMTGLRPVIALSPWELHLDRFKAIEPHTASRPIRSIAWALALVASGRIHAVATFESNHEWDVAAGVLLIEESGGTVYDAARQGLDFNRPDPRYRGLIALGRHCPDSVAQSIHALSRISDGP